MTKTVLKYWLNPEYIKEERMKSINKQFQTSKPFHNLELENFFNANMCNKILNALSKEKFDFKESDLFQLSQTEDMKNTKNKVLKEFREFLISKEFIKYMEDITSLKLNKNKIDFAGSLYQDTDYLLCHDDRLEGRKIAFLIYLSDFEDREGGCLNLFSSKNNLPEKAIKSIVPKFNKFAFFEVSNISFHEVEEVIVDKQRIAVGGWFHEIGDDQ